MKSMNKKIVMGVLSVALMGVGANNASASLLGHIVNGVGGAVGGVGGTVGGVVNGAGYTVDEVLGGIGATVGAGAALLQLHSIDLSGHGIDVSSWTEADAQVLVDLQALGIDIDALVDAAAIADANIITNHGVDIDALVCVLANGSLDVSAFGTNVVSTDLVVNIGAALGFVIDPTGLDLGLAVGECTTCDAGPNGPTGPNNPGGQPTSPVPEPATAALGLMGLGAMAIAARRRRNK